MKPVDNSDALRPGGKPERKIMGALLLQARPYWLHLLAIFIVSLLATPLALLGPVPLKIIADSVVGSQPLPHFLAVLLPRSVLGSPPAILAFAAALLIGTALLSQLQGLGGWLLQAYTGEKLVFQFRAKLFRHAQRLSFSYHDTKGSADSAYRIQYDSPSINHILIQGIIPIISAISMLAGVIYVAARLDRQLVLIALSVAPALFLLTRVYGSRLKRRWVDLKTLDSSSNSIVQEVLSSMRVVKAFGREEHEQDRFMVESNRRLTLQIRTYMLQGGYDLLVGMTVAVGTAAVLYVGATHVRAGLLTLGELLLVVGYVAQLFDPLKMLSKKMTDLQASIASAERAFALLKETPEVTERPNARHLVRARGHVEFEAVSFGYQAGSSVLSEVTLNVPPGTRVGIQGRTGSGKSTLLSLLTRFYDVSGGRILLDGVDVRDYKLDDLREQFGIVLQDPLLFSTSIEENIAYGRIGATGEQIKEAAALANAHDFIENLPAGYATLVGERGVKLSGGERQRVSLARAFLKDAPILILDEPTSAVDSTTETLIMEAMGRLMEGRTTFMIAHRLSTLDTCDLRVEMRDGRLCDANPGMLADQRLSSAIASQAAAS